MKRFIFLLFFGLLAFAADAQRGYGFPAQDLRNPPDTGMIMITNPWPTGAKTVAAFWQYKSLIPGWGGGGSVDLTGIRDSLDYLYGQTAQPDTAQQVVYKPNHGQNPALCPGGILPLTENFDAATAANAEDLPFTYAIGTRGPDSLVIKASGFYTSTAHGLTIGQVYYQQDSPCDLETTPGTISAAVLLVIDANTIQLIDRSGLPGSDAVRIWIPSSQFTSRGDDPAAPRDSTVGAIALQYQSVLARPGAIFVYQLPAGTNNPTYTAPSGESSTPARAWFWDGTRATRIADAVIAVDMSATSVGGRALIPASNGTAAEAIQYISDNYENLNLPNGTVLYWKGSGTDVNPDTAYMVIDNPTIVGGQRVMLVKSLAAGDGNGIYGGSGSLPSGGSVVTTTNSNQLSIVGSVGAGTAVPLIVKNIATSSGGGSVQMLLQKAPADVVQDQLALSQGGITRQGFLGNQASFILSTNVTGGAVNPSVTGIELRSAGTITGPPNNISFRVSGLGAVYTDSRTASAGYATPGIQYAADYSSSYTDRSLPDKGYTDSRLGGRALLNTTAPTAGQTYLWDAVDARFEIGTPGGSAPTDLSFTGSASPVTLNSSTGTDVTLTAGTNTTFSQSANNLTINAAGSDLTFTGASSPFTLASSNGTDVTFAAGANVTLSRSSNQLTIAATGDGNGIYGGSGTVPNGTAAALLGTFAINTPGGAGLYLNQSGGVNFLGQSAGTRVQVNPSVGQNRIDLYGNGTDPANVYYQDADGSAQVIIAAPSVVNSGGYKITLPADAPNDGEVFTYNGSGVYDWKAPGPAVYFSGRTTTGYSVAGTAANVVFDANTVTTGVTANNANGSFTVTDARVYDLIYSVSFTYPDGTADEGTEFWLELNGTPLEETRMRASRLTASTGTLGTYSVTGNTIVSIPAAGVIRLRCELDSPDTDFVRASFTGKSLN